MAPAEGKQVGPFKNTHGFESSATTQQNSELFDSGSARTCFFRRRAHVGPPVLHARMHTRVMAHSSCPSAFAVRARP